MQQAERGEFGVFDASVYRIGIVRAAFNSDVTESMLLRSLEACKEYGLRQDRVAIKTVAGCVEIPVVLRAMAATKTYDCLIAIGAVIRGETPHFDYVLKIVSEGIVRVMHDFGVPVGFGVLACNNREQALSRLGSGRDAAVAALHCARVIKEIAGARL